MALVNHCLKWLLLAFYILLGIVGVLILLCALLGGTVEEHDLNTSVGLVIMGVTGVVGVLISLMGAYAVKKENICILKTCLCIMATGTAFFFYIGISVLISKSELKCCGIKSFNDWGSKVPDTCKCPSFELNPSQCMEVKTTIDGSKGEESPNSDMVWIYREACGPLILENVDITLKATIGLFVGLGFFTLIGEVLTYMIIHQMKKAQSSRFQETICDNRSSFTPEFQAVPHAVGFMGVAPKYSLHPNIACKDVSVSDP